VETRIGEGIFLEITLPSFLVLVRGRTTREATAIKVAGTTDTGVIVTGHYIFFSLSEVKIVDNLIKNSIVSEI